MNSIKQLGSNCFSDSWHVFCRDALTSLGARYWITQWHKLRSAIAYGKQAEAMRRKACLIEPESTNQTEALGVSLTALGAAYVEKDDQASARPHLVEAVRLFKALDEANKLSDKGYESLNNAETILNKQGRPKWIWPFRLGASRRE